MQLALRGLRTGLLRIEYAERLSAIEAEALKAGDALAHKQELAEAEAIASAADLGPEHVEALCERVLLVDHGVDEDRAGAQCDQRSQHPIRQRRATRLPSCMSHFSFLPAI